MPATSRMANQKIGSMISTMAIAEAEAMAAMAEKVRICPMARRTRVT